MATATAPAPPAPEKSTTGRSLSPAVRALRPVFRRAERVAPWFGAWLVDRLWFRLPDVPERARRLRVVLPPGTPFEVASEAEPSRARGVRRKRAGVIRGIAWENGGPTVYLVHGWGGWGLQLAAFVEPLLEAGFSVVTFDAPSHGESDPGADGRRRTTLLEMADAFERVVAARGPAYGVVAHSIGAAGVTLALRNGLATRRVVFVAAATEFEYTVDLFQRTFEFGPRIRAGFLRRFTRRFGRPMEDFAMLAAMEDVLEQRDLPGLLAIHDRDDTDTACEGSVAVASRWPAAELRLTDGLGHYKILRDAAVVSDATAFLTTAK